MKLLVVGSKSLGKVDMSIYLPPDIDLLIAEGDCEIGASAKEYARIRNIPFVEVTLRYSDDKSYAEYRKLLVEMIDGVLLFWDGESSEMLDYNDLAVKNGKRKAHVII